MLLDIIIIGAQEEGVGGGYTQGFGWVFFRIQIEEKPDPEPTYEKNRPSKKIRKKYSFIGPTTKRGGGGSGRTTKKR